MPMIKLLRPATSCGNCSVLDLRRHERMTQLDVHRRFQILHQKQQRNALSANNKVETIEQNNEG